MTPAASTSERTLGTALKLFADPTRLRILALVDLEELSVGELSRALDLSQSRVSNHLRHLRDADLLSERHEGSSTYLRTASTPAGDAPGPLAGRLWSTLKTELAALPEYAADRVRLERVLQERTDREGALFDRMAAQWDKFAGAFESGGARERAAVHLLPPHATYVDIGCGAGYMAEALLGTCRRLILVDRSRAMLDEARRRLEPHARGTQLEFRQGELDALPLESDEADGLLAGMVLHHLGRLDTACAEMYRVLRPGAAASVLELMPHREEWMRQELGDRHLGLEPRDVLAALQQAGFEPPLLDPVHDRYRPRRTDSTDGATPSLALYVARGRKPAGA